MSETENEGTKIEFEADPVLRGLLLFSQILKDFPLPCYYYSTLNLVC